MQGDFISGAVVAAALGGGASPVRRPAPIRLRSQAPQQIRDHHSHGLNRIAASRPAAAATTRPVPITVRKHRIPERPSGPARGGGDLGGAVGAGRGAQEKGSWLSTMRRMLHRHICRSGAPAGAPGMSTGAPVTGSSRQ